MLDPPASESEWKLELEFRKLEVGRVKDWEQVFICKGCEMPFVAHKKSTREFCGVECQSAYYERGHVPLRIHLAQSET